MKQVEWCAALLWFLSLCLVLKYFQQSYPISHLQEGWCSFVIPFFTFGLKSIFQQSCNFYLWKQGLSDVLLFVIPFFVFGLKSIFNSPTNSYLWKQGLVMCCSLWFLSLCLSKSIFNSPTQFLPMKAGIEWCAALVIPFFVFGLRVFFNSPQFLWKQGLSDVLLFCDSFLCVWS
jgi:hypothetical protein